LKVGMVTTITGPFGMPTNPLARVNSVASANVSRARASSCSRGARRA
jgi:hypothetical protein